MPNEDRLQRRTFLGRGAALSAGVMYFASNTLEAMTMPRLRVTGCELLPIRATERTVWLIVRIRTDAGLSGLGEASDAFGFAKTTKEDSARMESELKRFFALIDGKSPLEIGDYRRQGEPLLADGGLPAATAFSAIEQALWDLAGKALEVPTHTLFGGRVREALPVYANINRATKSRTPAGFAATAKAAVQDGFRAVKAAPFDGFPAPGSPASAIDAAVENGITCLAAMRGAERRPAQSQRPRRNGRQYSSLRRVEELLLARTTMGRSPLAKRPAHSAGTIRNRYGSRAGSAGAGNRTQRSRRSRALDVTPNAQICIYSCGTHPKS